MWTLGNKFAQQVFQSLELVGLGLNAHQEIGNGDRSDQFAVAVEIPVKTVGVDQIRQGLAIAILLVLVGILHAAQADIDVFGFDMANHDLAALDDEIRRTASYALGFVQCGHALGEAVEQALKCRTIRMLSGRTGFVSGYYFANEVFYGFHIVPCCSLAKAARRLRISLRVSAIRIFLAGWSEWVGE